MTFRLSTLIPTAAVDVVGVYDVDYTQLFPAGRPIKATVKETSTFFKHPLEDSTTRTDHIIFNPIEIGLSVILSGDEYRNTYHLIKQVFRNQTALIVQTKTDTYQNMYIQGMPHDEAADSYDAVIMQLQIAETQLASATITFLPSNSNDSNTADRGQQEPKNPSADQKSKGTLLSRTFGGFL